MDLREIGPDQPVLIAGPTASGKSALALRIAEAQGGVIVNADALQVWSCWRVLSARPDHAEEARAPHRLYGHMSPGQPYSTGHWLRDVAGLLDGPARPIIVGGTGLNFTALTEGLAVIPETPAEVRAQADAMMQAEGAQAMLANLDAATRAKIDTQNPVRIQRAWEVLQTTGRGLADWQQDTPPPLLSLENVTPLILNADRDWLNARIDLRFDQMLDQGALAEVEAVLPIWDPSAPWAKAIGAPDLVAYLQGDVPLETAIEAAKLASRQYAKRQRTWFRNRMKRWRPVSLP